MKYKLKFDKEKIKSFVTDGLMLIGAVGLVKSVVSLGWFTGITARYGGWLAVGIGSALIALSKLFVIFPNKKWEHRVDYSLTLVGLLFLVGGLWALNWFQMATNAGYIAIIAFGAIYLLGRHHIIEKFWK